MASPIPIIDIAPISTDNRTDRANDTIEQIRRACHEWGFFQIVNHGVAPTLIRSVWNNAQAFFALPHKDKLAIARTKVNPRGYYDRELTKNRRDLKEVFDYGLNPSPDRSSTTNGDRALITSVNQWPNALRTFRPTLLAYFTDCERIAFRLLAALCITLDLPRDCLAPYFQRGHTSFARLNYYPLTDPLDQPDILSTPALGDQALHHHTDAGALTLLLQDPVGGLQVQTHDGWFDIEPIADALVVNVGDMMQVWSNDRYPAAVHRVRPVTTRPRYSIPFFFNPNYDTDYAPLPTPDSGAPRYRTINWGEFRRARADGDYADVGHEIQVADFRLRS